MNPTLNVITAEMSPREQQKTKEDINISVEEYRRQRMNGCRYVVPEGQYARRICNRTLHDRVLHLCEEHSTYERQIDPSARM